MNRREFIAAGVAAAAAPVLPLAAKGANEPVLIAVEYPPPPTSPIPTTGFLIEEGRTNFSRSSMAVFMSQDGYWEWTTTPKPQPDHSAL